uniref:DUF1618 domain-containing protein n=1 Tax=Oryza rufipogon TaxID=4529 RepID=A0A0E0QVB3_ORYRU
MGFVDLWLGIVLVNLLQEEPAPSYIQLPPPLRTCLLHASDVSNLMPKLPNYFPILEKLHVGHPVLSLHIDHLAHKAWILPIDLRNGVIQQPIDFVGADRTVGICETPSPYIRAGRGDTAAQGLHFSIAS